MSSNKTNTRVHYRIDQKEIARVRMSKTMKLTCAAVLVAAILCPLAFAENNANVPLAVSDKSANVVPFEQANLQSAASGEDLASNRENSAAENADAKTDATNAQAGDAIHKEASEDAASEDAASEDAAPEESMAAGSEADTAEAAGAEATTTEATAVYQ